MKRDGVLELWADGVLEPWADGVLGATDGNGHDISKIPVRTPERDGVRPF